ncbi:hypothetical protein [Kitasatospora paranensis]|uniref:Phosphatidic acid phosphatase type 2/haloperoxidase domain-containing protein n=1 Tax=Kitasatospora paranensis TaxID=258053 RepID=A0ABW2G0W6_9ACTN
MTSDQQGAIARRITDLADPKNTIIAVSLIIGCGLYGLRGAGWAAIAIAFAAVLPILLIVHTAAEGRWADRHLTDRQKRMTVLPAISASVAAGICLQVLTSAPRPMVGLTAAMWATITAIWPITRWWKISVHTAVLSGALAMLAQAFDPWWLAGAAGVAVVAWSRVRLRDHTPAQTLAGAALGAVVAGLVFAAF